MSGPHAEGPLLPPTPAARYWNAARGLRAAAGAGRPVTIPAATAAALADLIEQLVPTGKPDRAFAAARVVVDSLLAPIPMSPNRSYDYDTEGLGGT